MTLHRASGRWRLGLLLAFTTTLLWATLPVALKVALEAIDPWTLTWFRFLVAAMLMGPWLIWRGRLPDFGRLSVVQWRLLAVAAVMLTGNFVLYLLGLHYTTPANAQLLIQLAPLLLTIGGVVIFREQLAGGQWLGLALLVVGLSLFFSDQLSVHHGWSYAVGSLLLVVGAVAWAIYGLAQKQLLLGLDSAAVMGFIYCGAALILWPTADHRQLLRLDRVHALATAYCALNTIGAYGAFAEALAHWEASRVGVVLALTPFMTIILMELLARQNPGLVAPEHIAALGWTGAALIVGGSMAVSLLGRRSVRTAPD
ncbi:MAG: DMT family transporter [Vicinamibacterales bacterium]